jgi:hypothetical protein
VSVYQSKSIIWSSRRGYRAETSVLKSQHCQGTEQQMQSSSCWSRKLQSSSHWLKAFVSVGQVFGSSFVHGGEKAQTGAPQYIDPYQLLAQDEVMRQYREGYLDR